MNLSQILNYAEKNNCQTEINFAHSFIDRQAMRYDKPKSISKEHIRCEWDKKTQDESYVGIQIKTRWSTMYYWFICYHNEATQNTYHFDHAYNQNTGQTIRGRRRAFQLMDKIESQIKFSN